MRDDSKFIAFVAFCGIVGWIEGYVRQTIKNNKGGGSAAKKTLSIHCVASFKNALHNLVLHVFLP